MKQFTVNPKSQKSSVMAAWNGWCRPKWILENSNTVPNIQEAKKLASYIQDVEYTSGFRTFEDFIDRFPLDDIYLEMLDET